MKKESAPLRRRRHMAFPPACRRRRPRHCERANKRKNIITIMSLTCALRHFASSQESSDDRQMTVKYYILISLLPATALMALICFQMTFKVARLPFVTVADEKGNAPKRLLRVQTVPSARSRWKRFSHFFPPARGTLFQPNVSEHKRNNNFILLPITCDNARFYLMFICKTRAKIVSGGRERC